jgi:hypothetical protein
MPKCPEGGTEADALIRFRIQNTKRRNLLLTKQGRLARCSRTKSVSSASSPVAQAHYLFAIVKARQILPQVL